MFNSKDRRTFIEENFSQKYLEVYDKIIPGGFQSDFGVIVFFTNMVSYADIDMVCMNSFDTLIESNVDLFLPVDLNCIHGEGEHNIYNAFIGVIPNHPFLRYV